MQYEDKAWQELLKESMTDLRIKLEDLYRNSRMDDRKYGKLKKKIEYFESLAGEKVSPLNLTNIPQ